MIKHDEEPKAYWQKEAASLRRQVNLGWWLEKFLSLLLPSALVVAALALWMRHAFPMLQQATLPGAMAAVLAFLALVAWRLAKPNFETQRDAMIRIEAERGLHGALSSAHAGVLPWPEPATPDKPELSWNLKRSAIPLLLTIAVIGSALLLPISQPAGAATTPPSHPPRWSALEEQLDRLDDQEIIDETYLEETRKKLEELKAQSEDQWFSHNSLEATDSLDKSHQAEALSLKLATDQGAEALDSLLKGIASGQIPETATLDDLNRAAEAMQGGAMKPNADLLAQMKQLDLQDLQKLKPEQLSQLKENLNSLSEALGEAMKDENRFGDEPGEGEGDEGEQPGNGDIQRGPGHDPKLFGKRRDALELGSPEALTPDDPSRMTPGDLLQMSDSQHELDRSPSRPGSGGTAENLGKGGDRVWRDSLDPDEQRSLKRFFE